MIGICTFVAGAKAITDLLYAGPCYIPTVAGVFWSLVAMSLAGYLIADRLG